MSNMTMGKLALLVGVSCTLLGMAACDGGSSSDYQAPPLDGMDGSAEGGSTPGMPGMPGAEAGAVDAGPSTGPCDVTFTWKPAVGSSVASVALVGEWNMFQKPGTSMKGPDASGFYSATLPLNPGMVGYKVLTDGTNYQLDASASYRKYVGGVENSGLKVENCYQPSLTLQDKSLAAGVFSATVKWTDGKQHPTILPSSVTATLRKDGVDTKVPATWDAQKKTISVKTSALAAGKYTVFVSAMDQGGTSTKPLRLPFWVEADAFSWNDAVIYMAMVDRFGDSDKTNDAAPINGVDPRADYHGGDFGGVTAKIKDGTFDKLGIRAIWLSPLHTNPKGAYPAADGIHQVTGYHGYWPTKAREVEPRFGGEAALKALVTEAHKHGIRILQDFVVNHVHQEHEYFAAHKDWFRTGCVCGTNNCDWDGHRLDCLFASYMPDVNWTVPEVSDQFEADAIWWLDTFDLDGFRLDAVKHVEDAAVINLSAAVRAEFEKAGTRLFMTGETATGWSDCGLACNQSQYDLISRAIGPHGLDGQIDFVTYYAVPTNVFSADNKGMIHADYWSQAATYQYPAGAIMTPYIGSQDSPRFITLASYRNQDGAHDPSIPGNQWSNTAGPPPDTDTYARHKLGLAWLLTQPGAPLVYYGDEYGQWGGADPNNRSDWRGDSVTGSESTTLAFARALGQARKSSVALRRGGYVPVHAEESWLVFARAVTGGDVALVAMTKNPAGDAVSAQLPLSLNLANGTVLHDLLGGPQVTVQNGMLTTTLGARGVAIYTK
jgi:glycosidase